MIYKVTFLMTQKIVDGNSRNFDLLMARVTQISSPDQIRSTRLFFVEIWFNLFVSHENEEHLSAQMRWHVDREVVTSVNLSFPKKFLLWFKIKNILRFRSTIVEIKFFNWIKFVACFRRLTFHSVSFIPQFVSLTKSWLRAKAVT